MATQLFRDYLARVGDETSPGGFMVGLLTIASAAGALLRLSSLTDRTVLSRGETYFPSGFDYRIPDRLSESEQRSAIVLPVADRTILAALRSHPLRLALALEVVFSRTVDVVELGPFKLIDVAREYDASTQTLSLECTYRDVMRDPRPGRRYTPSAFPGLFGKPNLQGVDL